LDKPALKPLVSQPYEYREFMKVRASFEYHVEVDQHFYSVPHVLVRKQLEAIITANTIEILHGGKRVASHARSYEEGGKTTESLHMVSAHRHFALWDREHDLQWALSLGVSTHEFLQIVFSKAPHRDFSYRYANSIKSMSREYGDERLESACKRALEIGATETKNVRSILKNNLDQHATKQVMAQEAAFDHDNIRGADYYH
jgi:transposase